MTKRTSAVSEDDVEDFRHTVIAECICQLFKLFDQIDPDSGQPMLEVFCAHMAMGASIGIGVEILHPGTEEPEPDIKIARA